MKRAKTALAWLACLLAAAAAESTRVEDENAGSQRRHRESGSTASPPEGATRTLLENDPCLVQYCAKGRECVVQDGAPRCVCATHCPPHRRPVCASNGKVFGSHCEMHAHACRVQKKITQMPGTFCAGAAKAPPNVTVTRASETTPPPGPVIGSPDLVNEIEDHYYGRDECSMQEYEVMKDNLLLYHHARLMADDNQSKDYLLSMMFAHYDKNSDGQLEATELNEIAADEHMESIISLTSGCSLASMVQFDDGDGDGKLNINEFSMAFSKLYSVSVVSLDKALEVNRLSAKVGDNVEIKCDVTGSPVPPVQWRRHGLDLASLDEEEVRVFGDGSLYLTRVQLQHAGNYTCHAQRNRDVVQTHVLTVHTAPEVHVMPRIQSKRPGEEATMFCHVTGEPFPKVEWLKNDEPLKPDNPRKYQIVGNGTALQVRDIDFADTGAYMCQATSIGGLTRDISSLVVQEQPTSQGASNEERRFFAFHDWGVSVYEPSTCRLHHNIKGTDIIPGTQEYVCGDKGVRCEWGRAVGVANRYVYASQPTLDRVVIVSTVQMVVVDVVSADKYPVELFHVPHLDQVWLLNWRSGNDSGVKTVQVIRDAGQKRKHHAVHPEPIDGQYDMVTRMFVPSPLQELSHYSFKYGYVTHTNQRGLYKLDLVNLRYTRSVDLTPYNCVPVEIKFSALYGMVFMQCLEPVTRRPTGQLVLDYLTDSVISTAPTLFGTPHISPDSRKLVTFDKSATGTALVVQEIHGDGLEFLFDVKTSLDVSDLTFYPSQTSHGYDLYASGQNKQDLLYVNLDTGKVEVITGVGEASPPRLSHWGSPNRPISASGLFGQFMVTPASEAIFVVNGRSRTVNCEIGNVHHPSQVVWTTFKYH
ncbi:follistatin-related protein 5-like [Cylas formicarius]|uniref:follistatin-related protein 5-like n=1 Tax=Cylas formicarius TaxID=197179 RepID=UPI002958DBFB|nr:follistatin-related protein 5-like [Cylas formicarius]